MVIQADDTMRCSECLALVDFADAACAECGTPYTVHVRTVGTKSTATLADKKQAVVVALECGGAKRIEFAD